VTLHHHQRHQAPERVDVELAIARWTRQRRRRT